MSQVILLDRTYNKGVPLNLEIAQQLGRLSTKVDLDEIVIRQSANAYLAGKKVVVLYPDSSERFRRNSFLAFPYNMDPDYSASILLALQSYHPETHKLDLFDTKVEERVKERQLIDLVNEYIRSDSLSLGDRRGHTAYVKIRNAKKVLDFYSSLKAEAEKHGTYTKLLLALAFSATYEGMQRIQRDHKVEFESFAIPDEFLHKQAETLDLKAVLNGRGGNSIKKYWTSDELRRLNLGQLWKLEKAIPLQQNDARNA